MAQRTLLLIVGLLISVILTATAIDLFAPTTPFANLGFLTGPFRRLGERPPTDGRPVPPWAAVTLPRTARSLAGVAVLISYGLMLGYSAPQRAGTLVRSLIGPRVALLRYGVVGLALLILIVILTLLAPISLIAISLVPLFSFATGILLLTGVTLLATALGRWLRTRIGDERHQPLADLIVGLLAVMLVTLMPVIGTFFFIGCGALGTGALVMTHFGLRDQWQPESPDY